MTRAVSSLLAALLLAAALPICAHAAFMADPQVLYTEMKAAYDKGTAHDWTFGDQLYYYSTILNAGRAYSLQHPDAAEYGELATLTVQIGAGIHYDPLTNHDGATWWVREASIWVQKHSDDGTLIQEAGDLLLRCNAVDDAEALANYADADAAANVKTYPRDTNAQLMQLEADWRDWLLTNDPKWRSLAFERAAQTNFPVAKLPTTYGPTFVTEARSANAGVSEFTDADRAYAKSFLDRYDALGSLRTIATVKAIPHAEYMTTLAPADEYFGQLGYSILGIENQLKHVNFMLDYKYGNRESGETMTIVQAVLDMHKVYPRDRDMAKILFECITTLGRMTTPEADAAQRQLRGLLTVEYQDSPQAKKLLSAT